MKTQCSQPPWTGFPHYDSGEHKLKLDDDLIGLLKVPSGTSWRKPHTYLDLKQMLVTLTLTNFVLVNADTFVNCALFICTKLWHAVICICK